MLIIFHGKPEIDGQVSKQKKNFYDLLESFVYLVGELYDQVLVIF